MLHQNNDINIQKQDKRIDIQSKLEFQIGGVRKNRPSSASAVPRNNRPSSASSTRKYIRIYKYIICKLRIYCFYYNINIYNYIF
jgi:hypothetical protein